MHQRRPRPKGTPVYRICAPFESVAPRNRFCLRNARLRASPIEDTGNAVLPVKPHNQAQPMCPAIRGSTPTPVREFQLSKPSTRDAMTDEHPSVHTMRPAMLRTSHAPANPHHPPDRHIASFFTAKVPPISAKKAAEGRHDRCAKIPNSLTQGLPSTNMAREGLRSALHTHYRPQTRLVNFKLIHTMGPVQAHRRHPSNE